MPDYHPCRAWLLSPPRLAPGLLAFAPCSASWGPGGLLFSLSGMLSLAFAELALSHASSLKCLNVTLNVRETYSWTFHLKWVFLVSLCPCTQLNSFIVHITIDSSCDYWLIWGFSVCLRGMQASWGQGPHLFTDVSWAQRAVLGMEQGSIFTCLINECMHEQMSNCRILLQSLLSDLYLLYLPRGWCDPLAFSNTPTTRNQERGSSYYKRVLLESRDDGWRSQCCSARLLLCRLPTSACWILCLSEPEMARLPLDTLLIRTKGEVLTSEFGRLLLIVL